MENKEIRSCFKLGNNFNSLIYNELNKRINSLMYTEALNMLTTIGLKKEDAVGVLFNDYEIVNTDNEIIIINKIDNKKYQHFDLFFPIKNFISKYEKYIQILHKVISSLIKNKQTYIDFYNINDKDLPILTKYFQFPIELITDISSMGIMTINPLEFYDTIYTSIKNGDLEDLLRILYISEESFIYYIQAREILDLWEKIKNCMSFIRKYNRDYELKEYLGDDFTCITEISNNMFNYKIRIIPLLY